MCVRLFDQGLQLRLQPESADQSEINGCVRGSSPHELNFPANKNLLCFTKFFKEAMMKQDKDLTYTEQSQLTFHFNLVCRTLSDNNFVVTYYFDLLLT